MPEFLAFVNQYHIETVGEGGRFIPTLKAWPLGPGFFT